MRFEVLATDGAARRGRLHFERGTVDTPVFMPVGTRGAVRTVTPPELKACGAQMILGNTFHLMLRPGTEVIQKHGSLHGFMGWPGPILTDSGGYQIFSFGDDCKLREEGAAFRSPVDGAQSFLSPEISMQVQRQLGADVVMVLDDCPPWPIEEKAARDSMERSLRWAERSRKAHGDNPAALFGIIQGSMFPSLRRESLSGLRAIGFDGYAVGGLSVGEPRQMMREMLACITPEIPADCPRYLMGVGTPADLVAAVRRGIDMFDCVLPTRNGRNGQLFTGRGVLNVRNARYRDSLEAPEPGCDCYTCSHCTLAYLHHLERSREMLGARLLTLHNLHFYQRLMASLREAIAVGGLEDMARRFPATGEQAA